MSVLTEIAATALELDATLVSHDAVFDDGAIPDLRVEEWIGDEAS